HFEQNRCDSGTCGSVMTAVVGSRNGTGGTSTRFAPSRPRPTVRLRVLPVVAPDDPPSPAPVGVLMVRPRVRDRVPARGAVAAVATFAAGTGVADRLWPHSSQYPSAS